MASVKTAVSLPEDVFASLEALAESSGRSRSAVVAEAVRVLSERERTRQLRAEYDALADIEREDPSLRPDYGLIRRASRLLDEMGDVWEE